MSNKEVTSQDVAAIAARGLAHPGSLSLCEISAVCGSALTQAIDTDVYEVWQLIEALTQSLESPAPVAAKKTRRKRKGKGGRPKGSKNKVAKKK